MELDGLPVRVEDLLPLALQNYGSFTTMRVENMRVRGLALHLERLVDDSESLFSRAVDPKLVVDLIRHALGHGENGGVRGAAHSPTVVRVTVFAPGFDLAHPAEDVEPKILVTTGPAPAPNLHPARLMTAHYQRDLPSAKHVGLFGQAWRRRQAQLAGYDDVLFVGDTGDTDDKGDTCDKCDTGDTGDVGVGKRGDAEKLGGRSAVGEGATWNIGFVDERRVVWPQSDSLPGVTMRVIQEALRRNGITSSTEPVDLDAAAGMQAAFMTNAAIGVRAIQSIDGHPFAPDASLLTRVAQCYRGTPGALL